MKVALYARVSTADQNCELQLKALKEFCRRQKWKVHSTHVEHGVSGGKASRPELEKVMEAARLKEIDVVLVWKLDRWGRSVLHCIRSIQLLTTYGVRFYSLTDNIDTHESNPAAKMYLHILAAFAEFEREICRERVLAGIRAARKRGVTWGRKRVIFDRSKALALNSEGCSIREIARRLKVSKGVIQRALGGG